MATWYLNGSNGWPIDKREALKWFEGAAEKRFSPALCDLSIMHRNGLDGIVTQSDSRAMILVKESADLRYTQAQSMLARMYLIRNSGAEDQPKAVLYTTLAYTQEQDSVASFQLGYFFYFGLAGLSKSL